MTTETSDFSSSSTNIKVENVVVVDEGNTEGVPIKTGIGYLDHMLDQLNSHAQVGVGLTVTAIINNGNNNSDKCDGKYNPNWLSNQNQVELCTVVGHALGEALHRDVLLPLSTKLTSSSSRFCCPLDEALVECIISTSTDISTNNGVGSGLLKYDVTPYGIYPRGGRTHIGTLETFAIESFWKALAGSSKLNISFRKIRGDNAHHIVESSFKAFSRALRNYLDSHSPDLWNINGPNHQATAVLAREGKVERSTKETSISVRLCLDDTSNDQQDTLKSASDSAKTTTHIDTGIPTLDVFYEILAREAHMCLQIKCDGDRWVDDHHTAEDVSIAIGQCLTQALGSKAGLNRMWVSEAAASSEYDEPSTDGATNTTVEVTMDLSNRPCFVHNLHDTLARQEYIESIEASSTTTTTTLLTCEMFEHCLDSLVMNGRMTVHVVVNNDGSNNNGETSVMDVAIGTAKAFGRAFRVCAMVDPRRAGTTASSKGTLSV
jgi:imidazoleglycerol-phosphate dehydratase